MKTGILAAAALLALPLFAQDPVKDFVQGQKLLERRKYQAAAETFDKVAGAAKGTLKNKALLQKAIAMGRNRKVKKEDALAAAAAVPDAKLKAYATMSVLANREQWKRIVADFGAEKIQDWDEDYAYMGWKLRGQAYCYCRQYDKAIADLQLAEKNAGSDRWTLIETEGALFNACCQKKDYENALKYTDRIRAMKDYKGSYLYLDPVLSSVDAYIPLKKYEEARKTLAELDSITNLSKRNNKDLYSCRYYISLGKVCQAEGKTEEAKAAFTRAAGYNVQRSCVEQAKQLLSRMK